MDSPACSATYSIRRTKGAVTRHCLLDHDGYLPSGVVITEAKRHDVRVARTLRFDAGTVVVMDRGYLDDAWFGQLTAQAAFFVTRLKADAVYKVVERRRVPANLDGRGARYSKMVEWSEEDQCYVGKPLSPPTSGRDLVNRMQSVA